MSSSHPPHSAFSQLSTNGSNIAGIWEFSSSENPLISVDDIYTNHIDEILRTYGVEAARTAIVKEMSAVFGVYNIDVDIRHLELIADYMVRRSPSPGIIGLTAFRLSRVVINHSTVAVSRQIHHPS